MAGTAVPVEIFTNNPSTTVATNGYQGGSATGDAPSALTTETWTMTSSSAFPAASNAGTPPTQFHIADASAATEIILVTNISGTTWSVTRGVEGTTPVTHAAGATFYQVVTAAFLNNRTISTSEFLGNASAPAWPLYGSTEYALGGSLHSINSDGLIYQLGAQIVQGSAVTATSTTSDQTIPGLAAALGVGKYFVDVRVTYLNAGTIGSTTKFGFSAGPTLTALNMTGYLTNFNSTAASNLTTSTNVTSTTLSSGMWTTPTHAGTQYQLSQFWGTMTVSVAGTLQFVFANTTAADEITVVAGSIMTVRPNN